MTQSKHTLERQVALDYLNTTGKYKNMCLEDQSTNFLESLVKHEKGE